MSELSLQLFGNVVVTYSGQPIHKFRTNKAQALLAYLAVENERPHPREQILDLLWPGLPLGSARTNLRQVMYQLRTAIPEISAEPDAESNALFDSNRQTIQLNPQAKISVDAIAFEQHLRATLKHQHNDIVYCGDCFAHLEAATNLYGGLFLENVSLVDSNTFEDWLLVKRESLQRQLLDALDQLGRIHLACHRFADAEAVARRQIAINVYREKAYRQLLEALARSGQRNEALTQFEKLRHLLADELAVAPERETLQLVEDIEREVFGLPLAAPNQITEIRHNLPTQMTPFIGRTHELDALNQLLADPNTRLITIVAPGGMGKTRLALTVAEQQQADSRFSDGIFFIDLAPLNDASQIAPALIDVLSVPPLHQTGNDATRSALLKYLHNKSMLFVFDNFEHVLDGTALAKAILEAAPNMTIMATSRERLHLRAEHVYPIDGLEFPDWEEPEDATEYTSVQLFLQSARRIQADFELADTEDLTHLARICQLIAGMPLAIELAAGWVDMLSLAKIASELQSGFDLLETEMRDIPERHRSIRATLEHSWRLLDSAEQALFAKLCVFRGGFNHAAAQELAAATLRQLSRLINKSFLQFDKASQRYHLHTLMRQFGAENLDQLNLTRQTLDRHCQYFLGQVAEREADIKGKRQILALSELATDFENIRQAWYHAIDNQNFAELDKAIEGLTVYFEGRDQHATAIEFRRYARSKLTLSEDKTLRTTWYRIAARHLTQKQSEIPLLEACLSFARKSQNRHEEAHCLAMLGWTHVHLAQFEYIPLIHDAIAKFADLDAVFHVAQTQTLAAMALSMASDLRQAYPLFEQAIQSYKTFGDEVFSALTHFTGGLNSLLMGDFQLCIERLWEAERLYKLNERDYSAAMSRLMLAYPYILQGEMEQSIELLVQAVELFRKGEDVGYIYVDSEGFLDLLNGNYAQAVESYLNFLDSGSKLFPELTHWGLSIACCAINDYVTAAKHLYTIVHFAWISGAAGALKIVFPVAALLLMDLGYHRRATELLAKGFNELDGWSGWLEKWDLFVQLRVDLEEALGAEQFVEAWARGQQLDLWDSAETLLTELEQLKIG